MARTKPKGWVKQPVEHGLAAKGIRTALKHIREARHTQGYENIDEELLQAEAALEPLLAPEIPEIPRGDAPSSVAAAALGRKEPSNTKVRSALESATDAIRAFEGSNNLDDLDAAIEFMNEAVKFSNDWFEVNNILAAKELLMREYIRR